MMPIIMRSGCFAALVTFVASLVPCRATDTSTLQSATPGQGPCLTIVGSVGPYTFLDVDGPNSGTNVATGTNLNGLSNRGVAVGFDIDNNGGFHNFFGDVFGTVTLLNINGSITAMAFGINRADDVVGTDGNGNAFFMRDATVQTFIPGGGSAATAFGINDNGNIVGQYTSGAQMPGFFLPSHEGDGFVKIEAPSGPDTVNAQGVSQKGEIVGFYLGTDGQDHGFMADVSQAKPANLPVLRSPIRPSLPSQANRAQRSSSRKSSASTKMRSRWAIMAIPLPANMDSSTT